MVIKYNFGDETYEFKATEKEVKVALEGILAKELKELSADEIRELLKDEEYFDEMSVYYEDEIKEYFEHDAECEYEESMSDTVDGFDSYNSFCRYRNPNL